jgi:branched-chain amino acid transport system ATP-binding protein
VATPSVNSEVRAPDPVLQVDRVSKRFGGLVALNGVSLDVHQGEILGVIGPNGAGKTTLFNVITGVFHADSGSIVFGGREITKQPIQAIAALGLVRTYQLTSVYPEMTVRENINVSCHLYQQASAWAEILNLASARRARQQCAERTQELAELCALGNVVDEVAARLPYGQKKALSLAVALAVDPSLVLLDEPVAGMNSGEIEIILATIERVRQAGVSVAIVEHNMRVIMKICDRIVVLHFGARIADGTPAEIQASSAVADAYLGQVTSAADAEDRARGALGR